MVDDKNIKIQENTKEEKEHELFIKINEAVNIGMSIMDNYFDRIDASEIKKVNESDNEDNEENIEIELKNKKDAEELIVYESKDPYVLHSLPYLIGSKLYLENDHVGLKDLDSEEEEDEEEKAEEPDKGSNFSGSLDSLSEQNKIKSSFDDNSSESSEKSDVFGSKNMKNNTNDSDDNTDNEIYESNIIIKKVKLYVLRIHFYFTVDCDSQNNNPLLFLLIVFIFTTSSLR